MIEFKWRGWEGSVFQVRPEDCVVAAPGQWVATVLIHGVQFRGVGTTAARAIGKCRRELDNVRHAMWFTHRESGDGDLSRRRY